ncbi:MAG: DUF433 domain-containing protein [Bacteroidota bacterium]
MQWKEYIASDGNILAGKPLIKGTRISVELILALLSKGWSDEMILQSYPQLISAHLQAVLAYSQDSNDQIPENPWDDPNFVKETDRRAKNSKAAW